MLPLYGFCTTSGRSDFQGKLGERLLGQTSEDFTRFGRANPDLRRRVLVRAAGIGDVLQMVYRGVSRKSGPR